MGKRYRLILWDSPPNDYRWKTSLDGDCIQPNFKFALTRTFSNKAAMCTWLRVHRDIELAAVDLDTDPGVTMIREMEYTVLIIKV